MCRVRKNILFADKNPEETERQFLIDVERIVREAGLSFNLTKQDYIYDQYYRHTVLVEFEVMDPYEHRSF